VNNTNLSYLAKVWPTIDQIFASDRECLTLTPSLRVICEYPDKFYLSRNKNDCPTVPDAENRTIVCSLI